jgi:hypothetical protein
MGKNVTWAITYTGKITGTAYVTCSEDEHHPEKLGADNIDWDLESVEIGDAHDAEIIDSFDEEEE